MGNRIRDPRELLPMSDEIALSKDIVPPEEEVLPEGSPEAAPDLNPNTYIQDLLNRAKSRKANVDVGTYGGQALSQMVGQMGGIKTDVTPFQEMRKDAEGDVTSTQAEMTAADKAKSLLEQVRAKASTPKEGAWKEVDKLVGKELHTFAYRPMKKSDGSWGTEEIDLGVAPNKTGGSGERGSQQSGYVTANPDGTLSALVFDPKSGTYIPKELPKGTVRNTGEQMGNIPGVGNMPGTGGEGQPKAFNIGQQKKIKAVKEEINKNPITKQMMEAETLTKEGLDFINDPNLSKDQAALGSLITKYARSIQTGVLTDQDYKTSSGAPVAIMDRGTAAVEQWLLGQSSDVQLATLRKLMLASEKAAAGKRSALKTFAEGRLSGEGITDAPEDLYMPPSFGRAGAAKKKTAKPGDIVTSGGKRYQVQADGKVLPLK